MKVNFKNKEMLSYTEPRIVIINSELEDVVTLSYGTTGNPMGTEDFEDIFNIEL